MNKIRFTIPLALLVILTLLPAQAANPLPGAIFTTTVDGTIVNANVQYNSKCEVYLDGGPGPNAPAGAAGLPAGDYFFQVTDPSGKKLLSTDVVSNRRFTVSADGVITAYTGVGGPAHPTGVDQDHPELGAITVQLANSTCPTDYLDTPNNGGVYKAWVTRVGDFAGDPTKVDNPCGNGCFHGFVPASSKTDNFKVKARTATFCLTVDKQIVDAKGGISPGIGWHIMLTDSLGVTNNFFTDGKNGEVVICDLVADTYTVSEEVQAGFQVVGLIVNGAVLPASSVYSFNWTPGKPFPVVVFQNSVK